MGKFCATCAFTRTAIKEGESVLMVIVRDLVWDTYELRNLCLGYLEVKSRKPFYEPKSPLENFVVGKYDGFGSIEGFEIDASVIIDGRQFFAHRCVVEEILGKSIEVFLEEDAIELVRQAHYARVHLSGNHLIGSQIVTSFEVELQQKIARAAKRLLEKRQRYLDAQKREFNG